MNQVSCRVTIKTRRKSCVIQQVEFVYSVFLFQANALTGDGERRNRVKDFSFDFSYWSVYERSRHYASQERVRFA